MLFYLMSFAGGTFHQKGPQIPPSQKKKHDGFGHPSLPSLPHPLPPPPHTHTHPPTQQHPSTRKKTSLHPTTDSADRPIVLMVVNIFHSSNNGTDSCSGIKNKHRSRFQMSKSGPKTTPTNHGPREKQSDKEQRFHHTSSSKKSSGQGCRQNHRLFKTAS